MNIDSYTLEMAEQVAKQAITEQINPNLCPTCACNPQWSHEYPRLQTRLGHLERDLRKTVADLAWQRYENARIGRERDERHDWNAAKVRKQRIALAKMYMEVQHLKAENARMRRMTRQDEPAIESDQRGDDS
jgi:hypothetical protein